MNLPRNTNTYAQMEAGSSRLQETADCSVKAVALVCHVSYEAAHQALALAGRESKDGTPNYITRKAIKALGYMIRRDYSRKRLELEVGHEGRERLTIAHAHHEPEGWEHLPDMLLFSERHVSARVDGKVEDWASSEMRPIEHAWEVVPANQPLIHEEPPPVIYVGIADFSRRYID